MLQETVPDASCPCELYWVLQAAAPKNRRSLCLQQWVFIPFFDYSASSWVIGKDLGGPPYAIRSGTTKANFPNGVTVPWIVGLTDISASAKQAIFDVHCRTHFTPTFAPTPAPTKEPTLKPTRTPSLAPTHGGLICEQLEITANSAWKGEHVLQQAIEKVSSQVVQANSFQATISKKNSRAKEKKGKQIKALQAKLLRLKAQLKETSVRNSRSTTLPLNGTLLMDPEVYGCTGIWNIVYVESTKGMAHFKAESFDNELTKVADPEAKIKWQIPTYALGNSVAQTYNGARLDCGGSKTAFLYFQHQYKLWAISKVLHRPPYTLAIGSTAGTPDTIDPDDSWQNGQSAAQVDLTIKCKKLVNPTAAPTGSPTTPTLAPTAAPSTPTLNPTFNPTTPTLAPSPGPPTPRPTTGPTTPTRPPTTAPTSQPSTNPTVPTSQPSAGPTKTPPGKLKVMTIKSSLTIDCCETLDTFDATKKLAFAASIAGTLDLPSSDVEVTFVSGDSSIDVGFDVYLTKGFCDDQGPKYCISSTYFISQHMRGSDFENLVAASLSQSHINVQVGKAHIQFVHADAYEFSKNRAAYIKENAATLKAEKNRAGIASAWSGETYAPSTTPTFAPTPDPFAPLNTAANVAARERSRAEVLAKEELHKGEKASNSLWLRLLKPENVALLLGCLGVVAVVGITMGFIVMAAIKRFTTPSEKPIISDADETTSMLSKHDKYDGGGGGQNGGEDDDDDEEEDEPFVASPRRYENVRVADDVLDESFVDDDDDDLV
jgi:hypothetical protein